MISIQEAAEIELNLKGKDCLTLTEFTGQEIEVMLAKAIKMKEAALKGEHPEPLKGKILAMIFEKNSTRTRVSFEAGMIQLGGQAIFLTGNDMQIGRGEPIPDTAKVLSEYVDAIMIRTFSHNMVEELAENASIPVINGLTDLHHPCQALADLQTIQEIKGSLKGLKLAYVGDGNNVAHSLLLAAAKVGLDVSVGTPIGYKPDEAIVKLAQEIAAENGSKVILTEDPIEAVSGADVIYTDVWTSMGFEAENEIRLKDFAPYQVNEELAKHAKDDYIFLHCLPAHRGEEVTAEVIDGSHSAVFQQAGNRMHAQKALLVELLK